MLETGGRKGYIWGMVQTKKAATSPAPVADDALTAEQNAALAQSIARGEAQFQAGEGFPGEAVFAWMRSWGNENELPAPTRGDRAGRDRPKLRRWHLRCNAKQALHPTCYFALSPGAGGIRT